ncbi:MAG: glycoside hydrolase family 3 C-terminal domain-containing protein [Clostridiales bacterium]|nr:glycoside hydrolase family 3 C-terminal domain-containing protein [Clostridiales bacterium]
MKPVNELISQLTLEEKSALLEGYQSWMTNAIPRLDIPAIHLTDGPVGVRKKATDEGSGATGLGLSYPSTSFPTSVSIANSWNVENAEKMGRAIGEECIGYDVQVLLGPALNLKRDPRCGRNFEYYSEDPLLAGKMASAFVKGVQSTGTAACPKHFALNNNENYRYMSDSVADERAVRELYLKAFEICVREGQPRTMMCSYNKVNGEFSSQNKWLLTDILRKEWGFDGMVMTDWGATVDRVRGVDAGLDLDMPGGIWENRKSIMDAVKKGTLSGEALDKAVANVLKVVKESVPAAPEGQKQRLLNHAQIAVDIAADCAVLLENDGILPLQKKQKILAVGDLFKKMRYQGAGSSGLNPAYLTTVKEAFDKAGVDYAYAKGYREISHEPDADMEKEALEAAKDAEVILFFCGLTELFESEGFDREDISIPYNQLQLLDKLCATGKKTVAVLYGGSPFEVPFSGKTNAILHMFLPGQGGGEATRRLLYGEANPSGKLSETWMKTCADIPFGSQYGKSKVVPYRESIYVGYRYFDKIADRIRYPFGHGMSYTTFEYSNLNVCHAGGKITAALTVTNTGSADGAEVVQLYVGKNTNTRVFKAEKELKAFAKVYLAAGESKEIMLDFDDNALAYYNVKAQSWVVENGSYPVLIGASSRDIRMEASVEITGQEEVLGPYSEETVNAYEAIAEGGVTDSVFELVLGRKIPMEPAVYPYTIESPISDFQHTKMGRFLYNSVINGIAAQGKGINKMPEGPEKDAQIKSQNFVLRFIPCNCPRALIQSGGGRMQMNMAYAIAEFANGHILKAIKAVVKGEKPTKLPCEEKADV